MKQQKKKRKEALPVWNLSGLVPAPARIPGLLAAQMRAARAFKKQHEGRLADLSPAAFGRAIAVFEKISAELSGLYAYAFLDLQTKLGDAKAGQLYQTVMESSNAISADLIFFDLEINKIPDAALRKKLKDKATAHYKPWLDSVRAFRRHQLSDDVEKALHERDVTGHAAWVRLYDDACARLRFPAGGRVLNLGEALHDMSSPDAKKRKLAARALEKGFAENIQPLALTLNTIVKEWGTDARQRGFKSPVSPRNLENQVDDAAVEALTRAVKAEYKNLPHRYYKLKAKWLGRKRLDYWDRLAPLPFAADKKISWAQAKADVIATYTNFHPEMGRIARRFFDEKHIHARLLPDKEKGAFMMPTPPGVLPYILLNFRGKMEDAMTLAHELGHGIHHVLSAEQGYLMGDAPLTVSETASVFGEMLAFQAFLRRETDPRVRKAAIASKVTDMLDTVMRQTAFHIFETQVHNARKTAELTPEQYGRLWLKAVGDSLGPAVRLTPGYANFWGYISHFFHFPFYVYSYAFGDCLVNALYAVYQKSEKGFADKYVALLKAGSTKKYGELLKPFGLDAHDPRFWRQGLSVIAVLLDELA